MKRCEKFGALPCHYPIECCRVPKWRAWLCVVLFFTILNGGLAWLYLAMTTKAS